MTQHDQFFVALIGRLVALRYAQERLLESIRECKAGPEEDEGKARIHKPIRAFDHVR